MAKCRQLPQVHNIIKLSISKLCLPWLLGKSIMLYVVTLPRNLNLNQLLSLHPTCNVQTIPLGYLGQHQCKFIFLQILRCIALCGHTTTVHALATFSTCTVHFAIVNWKLWAFWGLFALPKFLNRISVIVPPPPYLPCLPWAIQLQISIIYIGEGYVIKLATMTATATWNTTCIGHLGRCDTDRIVSIYVTMPKVAKASK